MHTLVLWTLSDAHISALSTITYDTLVRGGVSCTSAFVPDSESSPGENKAKCSRGLVVTPDTILASVENSAVVSATSGQPPFVHGNSSVHE